MIPGWDSVAGRRVGDGCLAAMIGGRVCMWEWGSAAESGPERVWVKLTSPDGVVPVAAPGVEVRVLLPEGQAFSAVRDKLAADDVEVRQVRHLLEDEVVAERDGNVTAVGW